MRAGENGVCLTPFIRPHLFAFTGARCLRRIGGEQHGEDPERGDFRRMRMTFDR